MKGDMVMKKYYFDNGFGICDIKAFSSIEEMLLDENIIEEMRLLEEVDIHSGMVNGIRYWGIGGEGVKVEIEALQNISDWWVNAWDEALYEERN